jgi:hypothetical protein
MTQVYDQEVFDSNDDTQYREDKRLMVMFYRNALRNATKSDEAGRPIFDEIDYVRILTPGSRDTFQTEATQHYKDRFPKQWDQYKRNQDQTISGTPLDQVPWMTVGQIAEFKAVNIHTVEGLVTMSDALSAKFMAHHQIKARAAAFLDAAAGAAPGLKLQAALEERDAKIASLEQLVTQLVAAAPKNEQGKLIPATKA